MSIRIPKRRLSTQWLVISTLTIMLSLSLNLLYFFLQTTPEIKRQAVHNLNFYTKQLNQELKENCKQIQSFSYRLILNDKLSPTNLTPLDAGEMRAQLGGLIINDLTASGLSSKNLITAVSIVLPDKETFTVYQRNWYDLEAAQRAGTIAAQFSNAPALDRFVKNPDKHTTHVYQVLNYSNFSTFERVGTIVIELNFQAMATWENLYSVYRSAHFELSNHHDQVLLEIPKQADENSTLWEKKLDSETSIHDFALRLKTSVSENEILSAARRSRNNFLWLNAAVFLLILLVAHILNYRQSKPLRALLEGIALMSTGDLSVRLAESPYQETEQLRLEFNAMAETLEGLYLESYEKGRLLKEAEYKLLEGQIQPHFLANVLQLIQLRAIAAGQKDIAEPVHNLAGLLRQSLVKRDTPFCQLKEELKYVQYYLALQKERFGSSLHYSIEASDEDILENYIPWLSIQPLVENALIHGIENKVGGGFVKLRIWEEDEAILVCVEDNGGGFDVAIFDQARDAASAEKPSLDLEYKHAEQAQTVHSGLALINIYKRLQMLGATEPVIDINSEIGKGTKVLVYFPKKRGL